MNPASDRKRLLADVLAEDSSDNDRTALLEATLILVRYRRRSRQIRNATASVAALVLAGLFLWRVSPKHSANMIGGPAKCEVVSTQALPADAIITTQSLNHEFLVRSVAGVATVRTTRGSGGFHLIDDDELLALAAPRPALLVRLGPNSQKLIFVNSSDSAPIN